MGPEANRSFLYRGSSSGSLVYATLDSLALSRASLPLRLAQQQRPIDVDDDQDQEEPAAPIEPLHSPSPPAARLKVRPVPPPKPSPRRGSPLPGVPDESVGQLQPGLDSEGNTRTSSGSSLDEIQPGLDKQPSSESSGGGGKKKRDGLAFARNVLHYVPKTSRRYYRKSRELASKGLSTLGSGAPAGRGLSRDELRYVTISLPSNFVHVASATKGLAQPSQQPNYAQLQGFVRVEIDRRGEPCAIDDFDTDDYDDVGPPTNQPASLNKGSSEADEYDDVGPADEEVYDDVGPLLPSYEPLQPRDEEPAADEDVYDDVGPALVALRQTSTESHERVNSLYAGSSLYDKESEWEDLDDPLALRQPNSQSKGTSEPSPSKRKTSSAPRWRVRRQRSKASRRSSARSATGRARATHVHHHQPANSESSDDSNYETLETYEPDDFSSDSGGEQQEQQGQEQEQEAPNRAVPAPPREASLGHSLQRRMKMLRRTWSITKGSLGLVRRRASTVEPGPSVADLPRKYFSFKKHFRKSCAGPGLSTFYLEPGDNKPLVYSNDNWYKQAGLYASRANTQLLPVDHYSMLAEEPLYQFYAAAATRVAFESDSDGYEEVEELTPTPATTELARPGHRTLWCQTPQVINSGLLLRLSMEERKIAEAKFEILTSEASYLNSLRVLENEFASNHELVHEILLPVEREKLFGSVPEVLVASERFLAELEALWRDDLLLTGLSELLLKHGQRSADAYVTYCSNQVNIDVTLKELKAKKGYKYLETVSRIEMHPACHSLSLHSFLMLPMQRITRLPLLADAVLSKLSVEHEERLSWERVLSALSHIVGKCNEGARLAERRNQMDALARKLEYSTKVPPIDLRDRELIRSGPVVQLSTKADTEYKLTFGKKFHKTPLMLMLLTDYLLVTKLKSNSNEETFSVMETCKRSLVALESAPEEGPFAGRHAMVLTLLENQAGRQVELVLTCDNDTEKERWLDAVSPPKPSCVGETLYESWDCPQVMALYSYAPRQPDELALQPGDVINVLRKMNDGWSFGEKLLDGEQGWFPGNFTKEVASEHVRARNLRQRHRFLALSGSVLQRKAKQSLSLL